MIIQDEAMPDIKLALDLEGVIREALVSDAFAGESVAAWVGRPWGETVDRSSGERLRRLMEGALATGVAAFGQIVQRFPSGRELPVEYTTVRLGGGAGLLAIGKSLRAVTELQMRLVEAQQAMERDYWKLREVETRYRLLFNASSDAVLLLKAASLEIVELNPAAAQALGLTARRAGGRDREYLLNAIPAGERSELEAMLRRAEGQGKAPSILVHLGAERSPWRVRASLMPTEHGALFLVQLAPAGAVQQALDQREQIRIDRLVEQGPDGVAVVDREGTVLRANRAFLDLVQVGPEMAVLGQPIGRWLGRPGADSTVLLANVQRLGVVRRFATRLLGELGTETEVEISAVGNAEGAGGLIGVFVRDLVTRLPPPSKGGAIGRLLDSISEQVGKTPLRTLVSETVHAVERHYIQAALDLTGGNRTAAAEILGLSRQSLYVKLSRYELEGEPGDAAERT
ncbi:MAG: transcriptional regulator PpsR [Chromatiaceae bacterium]|jgi:transcriptional regulator PpsR|nr:transcriptional regulator PpsR [Chromatiaceae bacterium]